MDAPDVERLTRELALRRRLQEAFLVFSRGVAAKLPLATALGTFARDVNDLFGTSRTSIWLYDRDTRLLTLAGSSDPRDAASPPAIGADDESPPARALRRDAPELIVTPEGWCLAAPMRGWRRALGTLVIDGEPSAVSGEQFVELSGDVARQLATAVENLIVLDEAIRRHGDHESARARLAQTEKLAALGGFAAGIAHELNNPLQGILGHLELMLNRMGPDAPEIGALKRIYTDADRTAKMVQTLLAFVGSTPFPRVQVDVRRLIAEAVAVRAGTPNRPDVVLTAIGDRELPVVLGDPLLLQQALLNLIINAEQAIADTARSGQVIVEARADGSSVNIHIDDTGPGIAADAAARIFEPFFTTKPPGKGTGLGLAITFGIIQDHGGTIEAGPSPLGGARFRIQLPAAGDTVESPAH